MSDHMNDDEQQIQQEFDRINQKDRKVDYPLPSVGDHNLASVRPEIAEAVKEGHEKSVTLPYPAGSRPWTPRPFAPSLTEEQRLSVERMRLQSEAANRIHNREMVPGSQQHRAMQVQAMALQNTIYTNHVKPRQDAGAIAAEQKRQETAATALARSRSANIGINGQVSGEPYNQAHRTSGISINQMQLPLKDLAVRRIAALPAFKRGVPEQHIVQAAAQLGKGPSSPEQQEWVARASQELRSRPRRAYETLVFERPLHPGVPLDQLKAQQRITNRPSNTVRYAAASVINTPRSTSPLPGWMPDLVVRPGVPMYQRGVVLPSSYEEQQHQKRMDRVFSEIGHTHQSTPLPATTHAEPLVFARQASARVKRQQQVYAQPSRYEVQYKQNKEGEVYLHNPWSALMGRQRKWNKQRNQRINSAQQTAMQTRKDANDAQALENAQKGLTPGSYLYRRDPSMKRAGEALARGGTRAISAYPLIVPSNSRMSAEQIANTNGMHQRIIAIQEASAGRSPFDAAVGISELNTAFYNGQIPPQVADLIDKMRINQKRNKGTREAMNDDEVAEAMKAYVTNMGPLNLPTASNVGVTREQALQREELYAPRVEAFKARLVDQAVAQAMSIAKPGTPEDKVRATVTKRVNENVSKISVEQLAAIEDPNHIVTIEAGAGGGKTETAFNRLASLVAQGAVDASDTLYVSGTRSGAAAMVPQIDRLNRAFPKQVPSSALIAPRTIHSVAYEILHKADETGVTAAHAIGLEKYGRDLVTSAKDGENATQIEKARMLSARRLVELSMKQQGLNPKQQPVDKIVAMINATKQDPATLTESYKKGRDLYQNTYRRNDIALPKGSDFIPYGPDTRLPDEFHVYTYQQTLHARDGFALTGTEFEQPHIDMNDLPIYAERAIREGYGPRPSAIMLTERQDTNASSLKMLAAMVGNDTHFIAEGDMAQQAVLKKGNPSEQQRSILEELGDVSEHNFILNHRTQHWETQALNSAQLLMRGTQGYATGVQQVTANTNFREEDRPQYRFIQGPMNSMWNSALDDVFSDLGITPQQMSENHEAGIEPEDWGMAMLPQQTPILMQTTKERQESFVPAFKQYLTKALGSSEKASALFDALYTEEGANNDNQYKLGALLVNDARSRSTLKPKVVGMEAGKWDEGGANLNQYTMGTRAISRPTFYAASQGMPNSRHDASFVDFFGEMVPPKYPELFTLAAHYAHHKMGIPKEELRPSWQRALEEVPANLQAQFQMDPQTLQTLIDATALTGKYYEPTAESVGGVPEQLEDDYASSSDNDAENAGRGELNGVRNRGKLTAAAASGEFGRSADNTGLDLMKRALEEKAQLEGTPMAVGAIAHTVHMQAADAQDGQQWASAQINKQDEFGARGADNGAKFETRHSPMMQIAGIEGNDTDGKTLYNMEPVPAQTHQFAEVPPTSEFESWIKGEKKTYGGLKPNEKEAVASARITDTNSTVIPELDNEQKTFADRDWLEATSSADDAALTDYIKTFEWLLGKSQNMHSSYDEDIEHLIQQNAARHEKGSDPLANPRYARHMVNDIEAHHGTKRSEARDMQRVKERLDAYKEFGTFSTRNDQGDVEFSYARQMIEEMKELGLHDYAERVERLAGPALYHNDDQGLPMQIDHLRDLHQSDPRQAEVLRRVITKADGSTARNYEDKEAQRNLEKLPFIQGKVDQDIKSPEAAARVGTTARVISQLTPLMTAFKNLHDLVNNRTGYVDTQSVQFVPSAHNERVAHIIEDTHVPMEALFSPAVGRLLKEGPRAELAQQYRPETDVMALEGVGVNGDALLRRNRDMANVPVLPEGVIRTYDAKRADAVDKENLTPALLPMMPAAIRAAEKQLEQIKADLARGHAGGNQKRQLEKQQAQVESELANAYAALPEGTTTFGEQHAPEQEKLQTIMKHMGNPDTQLKWARALNVIMAATSGESITEGAWKGNENTHDSIHIERATRLFKNLNEGFREGTRSVDNIHEVVEAMNAASTSFETTGQMSIQHVKDVLQAFDLPTNSEYYPNLKMLEGKGVVSPEDLFGAYDVASTAKTSRGFRAQAAPTLMLPNVPYMFVGGNGNKQNSPTLGAIGTLAPFVYQPRGGGEPVELPFGTTLTVGQKSAHAMYSNQWLNEHTSDSEKYAPESEYNQIRRAKGKDAADKYKRDLMSQADEPAARMMVNGKHFDVASSQIIPLDHPDAIAHAEKNGIDLSHYTTQYAPQPDPAYARQLPSAFPDFPAPPHALYDGESDMWNLNLKTDLAHNVEPMRALINGDMTRALMPAWKNGEGHEQGKLLHVQVDGKNTGIVIQVNSNQILSKKDAIQSGKPLLDSLTDEEIMQLGRVGALPEDVRREEGMKPVKDKGLQAPSFRVVHMPEHLQALAEGRTAITDWTSLGKYNPRYENPDYDAQRATFKNVEGNDALYTLGYSKANAAQTLEQAVKQGGLVVDTRMHTSGNVKKGWSKEALIQKYGENYTHIPELGNTTHGQGSKITINKPKEGIAKLKALHEQAKAQGKKLVLLCTCANSATCHNTQVASMLKDELPGLQITHIGENTGPKQQEQTVLSQRQEVEKAFATATSDGFDPTHLNKDEFNALTHVAQQNLLGQPYVPYTEPEELPEAPIVQDWDNGLWSQANMSAEEPTMGSSAPLAVSADKKKRTKKFKPEHANIEESFKTRKAQVRRPGRKGYLSGLARSLILPSTSSPLLGNDTILPIDMRAVLADIRQGRQGTNEQNHIAGLWTPPQFAHDDNPLFAVTQDELPPQPKAPRLKLNDVRQFINEPEQQTQQQQWREQAQHHAQEQQRIREEKKAKRQKVQKTPWDAHVEKINERMIPEIQAISMVPYPILPKQNTQASVYEPIPASEPHLVSSSLQHAEHSYAPIEPDDIPEYDALPFDESNVPDYISEPEPLEETIPDEVQEVLAQPPLALPKAGQPIENDIPDEVQEAMYSKPDEFASLKHDIYHTKTLRAGTPDEKTIPAPSEEQKAVIDNPANHLMIKAGPGSGKTTSLIKRILKQTTDGILPEHILSLSTLRSGRDVLGNQFREWAQPLLPQGEAYKLRAPMTIHALSHRIVMGHDVDDAEEDRGMQQMSRPVLEALGYGDYDTSILKDTTKDQRAWLKQKGDTDMLAHLDDIGMSSFLKDALHENLSPEQIAKLPKSLDKYVQYIGTTKKSRSDLDDSDPNSLYNQRIHQGQQEHRTGADPTPDMAVYLYQKRVEQQKRLDFDDLPLLAVKAFKEGHGDLIPDYLKNIESVNVDEAQDLTHSGMSVLSAYTGFLEKHQGKNISSNYAYDVSQSAMTGLGGINPNDIDKTLLAETAKRGGTNAMSLLKENHRSPAEVVGQINGIQKLLQAEDQNTAPLQTATLPAQNMFATTHLRKAQWGTYEDMTHDILRDAGIDLDRIKKNIDEGKSYFTNENQPNIALGGIAVAAHKNDQMDFFQHIFQKVVSAKLGDTHGAAFTNQILRRNYPGPTHPKEEHELAKNQITMASPANIRSRSIPRVYADMTGGGQWSYPDFLRQWLITLSRATEFNKTYATLNPLSKEQIAHYKQHPEWFHESSPNSTKGVVTVQYPWKKKPDTITGYIPQDHPRYAHSYGDTEVLEDTNDINDHAIRELLQSGAMKQSDFPENIQSRVEDIALSQLPQPTAKVTELKHHEENNHDLEVVRSNTPRPVPQTPIVTNLKSETPEFPAGYHNEIKQQLRQLYKQSPQGKSLQEFLEAHYQYAQQAHAEAIHPAHKASYAHMMQAIQELQQNVPSSDKAVLGNDSWQHLPSPVAQNRAVLNPPEEVLASAQNRMQDSEFLSGFLDAHEEGKQSDAIKKYNSPENVDLFDSLEREHHVQMQQLHSANPVKNSYHDRAYDALLSHVRLRSVQASQGLPQSPWPKALQPYVHALGSQSDEFANMLGIAPKEVTSLPLPTKESLAHFHDLYQRKGQEQGLDDFLHQEEDFSVSMVQDGHVKGDKKRKQTGLDRLDAITAIRHNPDAFGMKDVPVPTSIDPSLLTKEGIAHVQFRQQGYRQHLDHLKVGQSPRNFEEYLGDMQTIAKATGNPKAGDPAMDATMLQAPHLYDPGAMGSFKLFQSDKTFVDKRDDPQALLKDIAQATKDSASHLHNIDDQNKKSSSQANTSSSGGGKKPPTSGSGTTSDFDDEEREQREGSSSSSSSSSQKRRSSKRTRLRMDDEGMFLEQEDDTPDKKTKAQSFSAGAFKTATLAGKIGYEMQFVGKEIDQIVSMVAKEGSDYRRASVPFQGSGTTGDSGFFNFNNDQSGINKLEQQLPDYSKVQLAQQLHDYSSATGVTSASSASQGVLPISQIASMGGLDASTLIGQYTTVAGQSFQGGSPAVSQSISGMLDNLYGGNFSSQNVYPTMQALSSILPTLQGVNPQGGAQDVQAMSIFKTALGAGMNAGNLPDVSSMVGDLSQVGTNPDLQQQYVLGQLYGQKNLTADTSLVEYQGQQQGEQQNLADLKLQQNVGGGMSLPQLQMRINNAQITMDKANLVMGGIQQQGQQLSLRGDQLNLAGSELSLQGSALNLQNSQLQYQGQQLDYSHNVASFQFGLQQADAQYGPIGADVSRTAYFDFMRNQQAAGYNPLSPETGTQFKSMPTFGLQNAEFYSGMEHQRTDMILSRSPLLSDAKFQEDQKYINEQEAFYKENLKLQNDQRAFEKTWQQRMLDQQAKQLEMQAKLLGQQEKEYQHSVDMLAYQKLEVAQHAAEVAQSAVIYGLQQQQFGLQQLQKDYENKVLQLQQEYLPKQIANLQALIIAQSQNLNGQGPVKGQNVQPADLISALAAYGTANGDKALSNEIKKMRLSTADNGMLYKIAKEAQTTPLTQVEKDLSSGKNYVQLQKDMQKYIASGAPAANQLQAGQQDAALAAGGTGATWTTFTNNIATMATELPKLTSALSNLAQFLPSIGPAIYWLGVLGVSVATLANLIGLIGKLPEFLTFLKNIPWPGAAKGISNVPGVGNVVNAGPGSGALAPGATVPGATGIGSVALPVAAGVGSVALGWGAHDWKKSSNFWVHGAGDVASVLNPGTIIGNNLHDNWDIAKQGEQGKGPLAGYSDAFKGMGTAWHGFLSGDGTKMFKGLGDGWNGYLKDAGKDWDKNIAGPTGNFFAKTLPIWWTTDVSGPTGNFFSKTLPQWWTNDVSGPTGNFFSKTLPQWWTTDVSGPVGNFFTKTMPDWFTTTIGTPISTFFTKTLPQKWDDLLKGITDNIGKFFGVSGGSSNQKSDTNGFAGILGNIFKGLFGGKSGGGEEGGGGGSTPAGHPGFSTPHVNTEFGAPLWYGKHQGVDFAANQDTVLSAFNSGEVTDANFYAWGGEVDIQMDNGLTERYLHMDSLGVHKGQHIGKGDYIGLTGGGTPHSGYGYWSKGSHSHVQVDEGNINAGINPWDIWSMMGTTNIAQYYGATMSAGKSSGGGGSEGNTNYLATGGIAMRATRAVVGEGNQPEAIIPLSQLATVAASVMNMKPSSTTTNQRNLTLSIGNVNVTVEAKDGNIVNTDKAMSTIIDLLSAAYLQVAQKES